MKTEKRGKASIRKGSQDKIPVKFRKVFVGGLPHSVTEAELKVYFSKYGSLEDYVVMVDRHSGKPRGFGFVTYSSVASVDRVMEKKETHSLKGKWVDCKRATPKEELEALQREREAQRKEEEEKETRATLKTRSNSPQEFSSVPVKANNLPSLASLDLSPPLVEKTPVPASYSQEAAYCEPINTFSVAPIDAQ